MPSSRRGALALEPTADFRSEEAQGWRIVAPTAFQEDSAPGLEEAGRYEAGLSSPRLEREQITPLHAVVLIATFRCVAPAALRRAHR